MDIAVMNHAFVVGTAPNARSRREVLVMVGKIALIIFSIEVMIMVVLNTWDFGFSAVTEDLTDSLTLTFIASPIIYFKVASPFVQAAIDAKADLKRELQQSQQLLEENIKLQESLQRANADNALVHDKVLQRVAADLHDGPAQLLSYVLLSFDRLQNVFEKERPGDKGQDFDKLQEVLNATLLDVRAISTGLSLPELKQSTLQEAIALAVRRHQELSGGDVDLVTEDLPKAASISLKTCTYRFVQEALANVRKHAQAGAIQVLAHTVDGKLIISVKDDGRGFDPETVTERGLGLNGMQARVHAQGGQLQISSELGGGATLTASLNLAA